MLWIFIFEKIEILIFGVKTKFRHTEMANLKKGLFCIFGVRWLRFILEFYISEASECWPFFDLKSRDMTSLKRHFLKNFSADFAESLLADAKLMLNKVP